MGRELGEESRSKRTFHRGIGYESARISKPNALEEKGSCSTNLRYCGNGKSSRDWYFLEKTRMNMELSRVQERRLVHVKSENRANAR